MKPEDIRNYLAKAKVLELASADSVARLAATASVVRWGRGRKILRAGESAAAMMIVVSGRVKITANGRNGKERILNIVEPGQTFGEMAVLDGERRSADADALEDTCAIVVPRAAFDSMLDGEPFVARRIIAELCSRLRIATSLIEDTMFVSAETRLARRLCGLAERRAGGAGDECGWSVEGLSQQELADAVGVSRESVNRVLRRWQSLGVVALSYRSVAILDIRRLKRLAREQESTD